MSGSGGYDYAAAEAARERVERRQRAARLAELRGQVARVERALRKKGQRSRLASGIAVLDGDTAIDTLDAEVAHAEAALRSVRDQLEASTTGELAARLARQRTTRPARAAPATPAPAEERSAVRGHELAWVRKAALAEAEAMLARDGARCDPDDLERLVAGTREIMDAPTSERVHTTVRRLQDRITDSIRRRERTTEDLRTRDRLRTLAAAAAAADRPALLAAIDTEPDLETLSRRVTDAVHQADQAADRELVTEAIADALEEIGCEIGEDFVAVLAGTGEVTVDIGDEFDLRLAEARRPQTGHGAAEAERYALRVRLGPPGERLKTTIVRLEGEPGDADRAAQQAFCDLRFEDRIRKAGREHGLDIEQSYRLEPGQRPAPETPPDKWEAVQGSRTRRRRRAGQRPAVRRRRHDR